jgi:hypothetical protein
MDVGAHQHRSAVLEEQALTRVPLGQQVWLPLDPDRLARVRVLSQYVEIDRGAVRALLHHLNASIVPFRLDVEARAAS